MVVSLGIIVVMMPADETILAFYVVPLLFSLSVLLYSWWTIRREIKARRIESLFVTEKLMSIILVLAVLTTINQICEVCIRLYSRESNEYRAAFFEFCFVIFDRLVDTFFAIILIYLVIRFTKPYTLEEHRSFMLVVSQNLSVIDKALVNAERMAAAERLLQACRDDANRTMIHLLS